MLRAATAALLWGINVFVCQHLNQLKYSIFMKILKGIFMIKKILLGVSALLLAFNVSAGPKYGFKYEWRLVEFPTPAGQNHINPKTYCTWAGSLLLHSPNPDGNAAASIYETIYKQYDGVFNCSNLYLGHNVEYVWYTRDSNYIYTHKTDLWYGGQLYQVSEKVVSRELRWIRVPCTSELDCQSSPPY